MSIVLGLDEMFRAWLNSERNKTVNEVLLLTPGKCLISIPILEKKKSPVYHGLVLTLNINVMFSLNLYLVRKAKALFSSKLRVGNMILFFLYSGHEMFFSKPMLSERIWCSRTIKIYESLVCFTMQSLTPVWQMKRKDFHVFHRLQIITFESYTVGFVSAFLAFWICSHFMFSLEIL